MTSAVGFAFRVRAVGSVRLYSHRRCIERLGNARYYISVLSARVAETEQGELQGMMASCTAFAAVVAPPFATVASLCGDSA